MMYVVFTAFLHSVDTGIANETNWVLNENVNMSLVLMKMEARVVWKNQEGMLKGIYGGKHGKKFFTKMNGGFDFIIHVFSLARIERSAQKQAKSGTENGGWCEKWWEKYDAKGWTEKGAHKYGRLNEQSWWEKRGEHYDGIGSVLKWAEPHYGWADVVGNSSQLLSIEPRERPPGVYPDSGFWVILAATTTTR
ncbi:hypothetical protein CsSME_00013420 [Camellia sinensis var. sinensis]|uniref:Uncharacterized protein n=1 Tax=Camellia sinensis var. sinensis TaxID=542762 RepID=A0A4V3WJP4_CAMSN|nr:hypothetical protein TEA_009505 [Camellia sinensis var. sinensis]